MPTRGPARIIRIGDKTSSRDMLKRGLHIVSGRQDPDDPRMFGKGHLFEEYRYANQKERGFHEHYGRGEKLNAGWANKSGFEKEPLES